MTSYWILVKSYDTKNTKEAQKTQKGKKIVVFKSIVNC
jgi:hypothetical protein